MPGRLNKIEGVRATDTHIAFRTYSRHDLEAALLHRPRRRRPGPPRAKTSREVGTSPPLAHHPHRILPPGPERPELRARNRIQLITGRSRLHWKRPLAFRVRWPHGWAGIVVLSGGVGRREAPLPRRVRPRSLPAHHPHRILPSPTRPRRRIGAGAPSLTGGLDSGEASPPPSGEPPWAWAGSLPGTGVVPGHLRSARSLSPLPPLGGGGRRRPPEPASPSVHMIFLLFSPR